MARDGDTWHPVTTEKCQELLDADELRIVGCFGREGLYPTYQDWWDMIARQLQDADGAFEVAGLAWTRWKFNRENDEMTSPHNKGENYEDQSTIPEPKHRDTPCRCGGRRPSPCSAPSYEEVCEALDKLHITCESAEPDVYRWYLRHPYAARARAKAINVLNRLQQSQNANVDAPAHE
jgi:hypothetical protein